MRDQTYMPSPSNNYNHNNNNNNSSSSSRSKSSNTPHPPPSASASASASHPHPVPLPLRILSHNIRYATSSPSAGELPWAQRLPHLLTELHYHTRGHAGAIICLQEVLHGQLVDILAGLNGGILRSGGALASAAVSEGGEGAEWAYYGRGRDDGAEAGEYSPILYRARVWEVRAVRTVWLSPTPAVPGSRGWDAASVRICGGVVLEVRGEGEGARGHGERGKRILVLNTHLDDQGRRSRIEGARIILREIEKVRSECRGIDGVVLSGDLNSEAPASGQRVDEKEEEEEEDAYTVLNAPGTGLRDIRPYVPPRQRYGHEMTFTGFDGRGDGDGRCRRIDFIHVDVGTGADVNDGDGDSDGTTRLHRSEGEDEAGSAPAWHMARVGYAVLPNRFDDAVYMSDHRAVVADLLLR